MKQPIESRTPAGQAGEAAGQSKASITTPVYHTNPKTRYRLNAQSVIRRLLDGHSPNGTTPQQCGPWAEYVDALISAHHDAGTEGVKTVFNTLARGDHSLARLVSAQVESKTIWTRQELAEADFPEPEWTIPDYLPAGLNCLAGRPKVGKSWLLLQIAHAISTGGMVFGRRVKQGSVLYLALEDGPRRLKDRLAKQHVPPSADITFALSWPTLDVGGLERLQAEVDGGGYRLVIVDTFSRIAGRLDQDDVGATTAVMASLQELAAGERCILLSDHHRKPGTTGADPIDDILGSTGKAAVVDTAWGLYRQRGKREVELKIVGRDVEETDLALAWDGLTTAWQCLGEVGEVRRDTFQAQVITAIRELTKAGELSTTSEIARYMDADKGNVSRALGELVHKSLVVRGDAVGSRVPYRLVEP